MGDSIRTQVIKNPGQSGGVHSPHYEGIKHCGKFARVHLSGEVTADSVFTLVDCIDTAINYYNYRKIEIVIASPGGEESALNHYIDALKGWDGVELRTRVITGRAASAAAVMLSLGDERYADRHAGLLYHHGRYSQVEELTLKKARQLSERLRHGDSFIAEQLIERACKARKDEIDCVKKIQDLEKRISVIKKEIEDLKQTLEGKKKHNKKEEVPGIEKNLGEKKKELDKSEKSLEKNKRNQISYKWWNKAEEDKKYPQYPGEENTYWNHYQDSEEDVIRLLLGEDSIQKDSEESEDKRKKAIYEWFKKLNEEVEDALDSALDSVSDPKSDLKAGKFGKLYNRLAENDDFVSPYIALTLRFIDHIGAPDDSRKVVDDSDQDSSFTVEAWSNLYSGGKIPLPHLKRHTLILGETGSGKTASAILPMVDAIINSEPEVVGAALIIDPKREILEEINKIKDKDVKDKDGKFEKRQRLILIGGVDDQGRPKEFSLDLMAKDWDIKEDLKRGNWETAAHKILERSGTFDEKSPASSLSGGGGTHSEAIWDREGSDLAISLVALMLMLVDPNAPTNRPEGEGCFTGELKKWVERLRMQSKSMSTLGLLRWALDNGIASRHRNGEWRFVELAKGYQRLVKNEKDEGIITLGKEGEQVLQSLTYRWKDLAGSQEDNRTYQSVLSMVQAIPGRFERKEASRSLFFGNESMLFREPVDSHRLVIDFEQAVKVPEEREGESFKRTLFVYQPPLSVTGDHIAKVLKARFFEAVLNDKNREKSSKKPRPLVAYVADEFHRFATSHGVHGEQSYLDTCRSFDAFCVLACQSVASIKHAFAVQGLREDLNSASIKVLLSNTGTKIFFRSTDLDTANLLKELSPQRPELTVPTAIHPPLVLAPGECYAILPDGRFERQQLAEFKL